MAGDSEGDSGMFRRLLGNRGADPETGERVPRDQHLTDKLLVLLSGIRAVQESASVGAPAGRHDRSST